MPERNIYGKTVGSVGALSALANVAALSAVGGLTGHLAAGPLTGRSSMSQEDKDAARKRLRNAGLLIGALAGSYTGSRRLDMSSPEAIMKSLFQRDYWSKNPEQMLQRLLKHQRRLQGVKYEPSYDLLHDLNKTSGEDRMSGFLPSIDTARATHAVDQDLYMDPFARNKVRGLVGDAGKRSDVPGRFSPFNLAVSALQAGAGFVPAYLTGKLLGSALALPPQSLKRLALTGGLAGAVANTGLIKSLAEHMEI